MTILRVGPELLVNTTTASSQRAPAIAALADGRYIVTWQDSSATGSDLSGSAVRATIFNADGSESVPEFVVNTTTVNSQFDSEVAVLPDGRFMVTWTDNSMSAGDPAGFAVRARIFNPDGSQSVPEFLINTTTANNQYESSVAALPGGRFVVSWSDFSSSGDDTSFNAIRARIFNANGTESVAEFVVNTTTASAQNQSSISVLADGRFIVSWSDASQTGGDTANAAIRARIFNADGSESVPEFLINTTTASEQSLSSITALSDGRFVATYSDFSFSADDMAGYAIRARIFNADGSESVPEFLVNTTTAGSQFDSQVAAMADGRFIIVWSDGSSTGGDTSLLSIRARIFNADGSESIPEFLVNTTTSGDQFESSVAVLADGRIVISWTDGSITGGDLSSYAVRSQIFDPTVFDGTLASDIATGGNFDDRYTGYGGNDTLSGHGGDDRLNGGEGEDSLNGDDGDDTLDGGNGGDNLFGGAGNDLVYGRSGNEVLNGGTGGDHLWGGGSSDQHIGGDDGFVDLARYDDGFWGDLTIRLDNAALNTGAAAVGDTYSGIEGLVGGHGNDSIHGDGLANVLRGSGGNDAIYGGVGNDTIGGDAGNDVLIGGAGADSLVGDAGARDRVQYTDSAAGLRVDLQVAATNTGIAAGDVFSGVEDIFGSVFGDSLLGDTGGNALYGDAGNDTFLDGRLGNDNIFGGADNDVLIGGQGADFLDGGAGTRDRVQYTEAAGLRVDLQVAATNTGNAAGDTFTGIEDLFGSFQTDTLLGDGGGNIIWGASGSDVIDGRLGADTIYGGAGNDAITGGGGADVFVFDAALGATNVDTLTGYTVADDIIHLENAIFTTLAAGALGAAFTSGAAATLAGHRIIYNSATGQLLYDADGIGAAAAVQFATLSTGLAMVATEFLVI